jgi:CRISPR-associated protein Cmr6
LKGPNSLSLLKVIPGVEYLFRFGCDAWDEGEISVTKLLDLFKNIFCDLGIGAKTNVGFGAMEEVNYKPKKDWCWLSARDFEKTQIRGEKNEKK